MKRLIGIILKILPIITIWQGLTNGGARLAPFVDTLKVALTQYEVVQVTQHLVKDFDVAGKLVKPENFSAFIKDSFHNQYSVLAREIKGDKEHNLSLDIWGVPFKLIMQPEFGQVKVASAGPDRKIETKDDIAVEFPFETAQARTPASPPPEAPRRELPVEVTEEIIEDEIQAERAPAYAEYDEEGYDRDGFNSEGYDRDGYDRNGLHRSEKEISTHEI